MDLNENSDYTNQSNANCIIHISILNIYNVIRIEHYLTPINVGRQGKHK